MRALVTYAHKARWLPRSLDPMWLVSYSPAAEYQGQANGFVPREALPTDEECAALFAAMSDLGETGWALAMRLKHRCGARWGELIALRPVDLEFTPHRVVRIERAVEQSGAGLALKSTKNQHKRWSTFPASLTGDLREHADKVSATYGSDALLFPEANAAFAERRKFQRLWVRAAVRAGWPMKSPGAARWHPHDLRHVAACWMLFDVKLDPAVVSMMLGHANPAFTLSRYVGTRGDSKVNAIALTDAW